MYDTTENLPEGKTIRIQVKVPKRRIYMPIKRADVFGDKRRKRTRTRQAQLAKHLKEM